MGSPAKKTMYSVELSRLGIEVYRYEQSNRAKIVCYKCSGSYDTAMNVSLPPNNFANRFRDAGWIDRGHRWKCPSCLTPRLREKLMQDRNQDKPVPPPAFITRLPTRPQLVSDIIARAAGTGSLAENTTEAPEDHPSMTISEAAPVPARKELGTRDVLRVLGKLNQYFAEGRYKPGWSDHRISDELGIPLDQVAEVREESPEHGPILVDAEVEALRSEVISLRDLLNDVMSRVEAVADRVAHTA